MTFSPCRAHAGLALALVLLTFRLDAAPGQLTSTGPFEVLGNQTSIAEVEQLLYPSSDPRWILASTAHDILETRDAGLTWRPVSPSGAPLSPHKLIVDSASPEHWFLYGYQPGGRLVKETRDSGRSWSRLAVPDSVDEDPSSLTAFFLDERDPRTMVVERTGDYFRDYRYFVSRDSGQTWSRFFIPSSYPLNADLFGVDRGVAWLRGGKFDLTSGVYTSLLDYKLLHAGWLNFDRARANTVFIGPTFAKSTDGGETFLVPNGAGRYGFSQSPVNPSHLATTLALAGFRLSLDRGTTWINQNPGSGQVYAEETAFDPANGELLLTISSGDPFHRYLTRRKTDGTYLPLSPNGFYPDRVSSVFAQGEHSLALIGSQFYVRDAEGIWQPRSHVVAEERGSLRSCQPPSALVMSPLDSQKLVVACNKDLIFMTSDGGSTWRISSPGNWLGAYADYFPTLSLAQGSSGMVLYYHSRKYYDAASDLYRSLDFGETWEVVGENLRSVVVHPDRARGVVAIHFDGSLLRYRPATGWQTIPTTISFESDPDSGEAALGNVAAHPELIYAVVRGSFLRSLDFGETWETISTVATAFEDLFGRPPTYNPIWIVSSIVIDPFDADHWLLPFHSFETHDGGLTFGWTAPTTNAVAVFDPLTPGRFLAGTDDRGVLERTSTLRPCPETGKAWCAHEGRFQLTVDWKDPQGNRGRATRVVTGSEDSGLFYFFDANNWELLVKVLDGCSLNQRFWLLAAGTTDVEYVLQVEDRWTGQIRHYANAAGQAAPAVVDTDAFAGCGVAPPPGAATAATASALLTKAAVGDTTLSLLGGKFAAKASWTDFSGGHGAAFTAPLRSESSGLFYFFSPNNWEMLLKVLDGCAINGHYWVLAAATTNVGYDLEISEPGGLGRKKTYNNPVGRTAPALIDLEAFSCP